MVLSGNTFENASSGQLVFGTYLSGTDWTHFASTLKSSNNTWYDPATANAFKIVNGHIVGFPRGSPPSRLTTPPCGSSPPPHPQSACKAPPPAYADFNVNLDTNNYTMASGKAVATIHVNSFGYGPVTLKAEGMPSRRQRHSQPNQPDQRHRHADLQFYNNRGGANRADYALRSQRLARAQRNILSTRKSTVVLASINEDIYTSSTFRTQ